MAFLANGGALGMLAAGIQLSHFWIGPDPKNVNGVSITAVSIDPSLRPKLVHSIVVKVR